MCYSLIRKILFCLSPEQAHFFTLTTLGLAEKLRMTKLLPSPLGSPLDVMGLKFPNAVGLAAGLDKNGEYIDALAALGFGFIEVGTVTPRPQPGNLLPRLFRLPKYEALINRMGFNNKGVDYLLEQLKKTRFTGILGINIGKNKETTIENAAQDYLYMMRKVIPFASYIAINISSPNTENLRQLQQGDLLQNLLRTLKAEQVFFFENNNKYVPLVVKISPDLTKDELMQMCDIFLAEKIDGIIATNTTVHRDGIELSPLAAEMGGLSGMPLMRRSTGIIKELQLLLKSSIPIIGCGGILSAEDAREKMDSGATLVQIYTGLIYQGPKLLRDIIKLPGQGVLS
ncbi:MAG: pyrD [Gammaproteobacteria bacterium]|jgi:dihydroorotate dehydrogenase|nr:pyrD [Gammaproteobacteria bacterium]